MLFAILGRPATLAVFVSDIDNVPAVCQLARSGDTAVLSYDVATPYDQERLRDGACAVERLLPPVPLLLQHGGVLTVGVGVKVIGVDDVGAYVLVAYPTGGGARSDGEELSPTSGGELALTPSPESLLVAVQLA